MRWTNSVMQGAGGGKRVRIYFGEHDRTAGGHQLVWEAVLRFLRAEGAAGASMFRGVAGFGAHSRLHTAHVADLVPDLPVVIEWIDAPDRVDRLLPAVADMVASGTITVDDVEIVKRVKRGD